MIAPNITIFGLRWMSCKENHLLLPAPACTPQQKQSKKFRQVEVKIHFHQEAQFH